jgi:acyl carrier protein
MPLAPPSATDVKSVIRDYIVENFLMGGALTIADEDSFIKHHVVDSTGFVELITFVEETWHVVVEDDEMLPENFDSLAAVDAYVRRKLAD